MNRQKGFTLIELLVVIAIIGILAAVILASLNTARNKARDKAIVSDLVSARTEMQLYFTSNGSVGLYQLSGGTAVMGCPGIGNVANTGALGDPATSSRIRQILDHANTQSGGSPDGSLRLPKTGCYANGSIWVIAAILKEDPKTAWCVDSTGKSKKYTLTTAGDLMTGAISAASSYLCN